MKKISLICSLCLISLFSYTQNHELVYWVGSNTLTQSYPQSGTGYSVEVTSASQDYNNLLTCLDSRNVWGSTDTIATVDHINTPYLSYTIYTNTPIDFDRFVVHGAAPNTTGIKMQLRWSLDDFGTSLGNFSPGSSSYNLTSVDLSSQADVPPGEVTFRIYYYAVAGNVLHNHAGPYPTSDSTPSLYTSYGRCFSLWGEEPCVSTSGTDIQTACDSYLWIDGNTYTASNTTATCIIPNAAGCDSIVSLDLTINTPNTNTTLSGATITSNEAGAVYQWLDCDNAMSIILGEINQSYNAISNGNYAVEVNKNGCVDTSACVTITSAGTFESSFTDNFVVYPNPAQNIIEIISSNTIETIIIYNVLGEIMIEKKASSNKTTLNTSQLSNGFYFVKLVSENNEIATKKIIISK